MCSVAQVSEFIWQSEEWFRESFRRKQKQTNHHLHRPASILHLLAIALDRYWAVTRVDYIRCQRNERRILTIIVLVWAAACSIALGPLFGWKDGQFESRIINEGECLLSQDLAYQIFATCTTFYFPLTLTLIFYWKIYQVSERLAPPRWRPICSPGRPAS